MPYGQPRPATYDEVDRHDRFAQGYTEATYTGSSGAGLPSVAVRDSNTELMYYGARFYDPLLGRFISPDSIVPDPGNPQALNRYSYTLNNPLRYTDPTGMFTNDEIMNYLGVDSWEEVLAMFEQGGAYEGKWGWLEVLHEAVLGDKVALETDKADESGQDGVFEGIFAVDEQGRLRIRGAKDDTIYDPAVVLGSVAHNAYHLYGWYPPDVDQPGMWMGIGRYQANRQYLHLESVDYNALLNPLAAQHLLETGGAAVFVGGLTVVFGAAAVASCTNPWSCAAGLELALAAVPSAGVASYILGYATIEMVRNHWYESTTYEP